ncbi:MAG: hypothetical protein OEZ48_15045 [Candidatus Bathyarchaeota archaeon]|nr:hypothetical protein [Candidatus Bathyarchaeota archaeon]
MERGKELKAVALLLIGISLITASCQAASYKATAYAYDDYDIFGNRRKFKVTLTVNTGFTSGRIVIVEWEGHKNSWYSGYGGVLCGRHYEGKVHVWDGYGYDKTYWFDFDDYVGETWWTGVDGVPHKPSTVHARVSWHYMSPWAMGVALWWIECEASVYVPS